tara:strand:+ start:7293 stop:7505 length:213 start_codon:yes stop_codon:yes gene_type:complete
MGFAIALAIFGSLILGGVAGNQDYLKTVETKIAEGYTWHYVGVQRTDPAIPTLSLQVEGEDPYYLWELKK